jgi:hypothetical protein
MNHIFELLGFLFLVCAVCENTVLPMAGICVTAIPYTALSACTCHSQLSLLLYLSIQRPGRSRNATDTYTRILYVGPRVTASTAAYNVFVSVILSGEFTNCSPRRAQHHPTTRCGVLVVVCVRG